MGDLPVARDGLERTVVSTQWDVESHDSLASLDQVKVLLVNSRLSGGLVVDELDLLEETGLVVLVELGTEICLGGELAEAD